MPVSKKTYTLGPMKQLIDLNGDITNFDLTFTATSQDGSPFELLVVDQTTLDSNPSLEYKKAEGTMSGNIVSDKGVYQNYFLLLKSDSKNECDVTIEIKEIPQKVPLPPKKQQAPKPLQRLQKPKSNINWFVVLAFVIGLCVLLLYFYGNKSSSTNTPSSLPETLPDSSPTTSEDFNLGKSSLSNTNLVERLKKLKVSS